MVTCTKNLTKNGEPQRYSWERRRRRRTFSSMLRFLLGILSLLISLFCDRLVGLVVKASASRAEDPGFESRLRQNFPGLSHTRDLKIGTPVATLPGAWHCRVSAGTGWPGVSIL